MKIERITRRKYLDGLTSVLGLASLANVAGCGRSRRSPASNTITVLHGSDDWLLGPAANEPARFMVFLPLVAWNARGELEGRVAERWDHSPDYRIWTVRDLQQHARETAVIHPLQSTLKAMRAAGFQAEIRYDSPIEVVYFK